MSSLDPLTNSKNMNHDYLKWPKNEEKRILKLFLLIKKYMINSATSFTVKMKSLFKIAIFWPKIDGENSSRYFYFEIPPFRKPVTKSLSFLINYFTYRRR